MKSKPHLNAAKRFICKLINFKSEITEGLDDVLVFCSAKIERKMKAHADWLCSFLTSE